MLGDRRRLLGVAGAAVVVAGAGGWWVTHSSPAPAATAGIPTSSAPVRRMNVVQRQTFAGTIGFAGTYTVVVPGTAGSTGQNPTQARAAVSTAQAALAADRTAAADVAAIGAATDAQAQAAVAAATQRHDQAAIDAAQAALTLNLARDLQANHQAQGRVEADSVALANARVAAALPGAGIITRLPAIGDQVGRGQALYEVDNRAVPLLIGDRPLSRELVAGLAGPDVREMKDNLVALGFANIDLGADSTYNAATTAAVYQWQASLGATQTGSVGPADAVFAASALRVTALHAVVGTAPQDGAQLLDATSTTAIVNVPLDPSSEALVKVGDTVAVNLATGGTTPGSVASVSRVAVSTPSPGQGGATSRSTVNVAITLSDPAAAGGLDQAPVTVGITSQRHDGVLAVPINSLLALEEGGYAVRRVAGRDLVAVRTGIFSDDGMVEVTGQLREGESVEVPRP